jgi:hypothetical protein
MMAGLALGKGTPSVVDALRGMEFGKDSQVNVPIAVLIWLRMMMKVDFGAISRSGPQAERAARNACGLASEAVFYGVDLLGLSPARFQRVDYARSG